MPELAVRLGQAEQAPLYGVGRMDKRSASTVYCFNADSLVQRCLESPAFV